MSFSLQLNQFNSRNQLKVYNKAILEKEQPEFLTIWEIRPYIPDC